MAMGYEDDVNSRLIDNGDILVAGSAAPITCLSLEIPT